MESAGLIDSERSSRQIFVGIVISICGNAVVSIALNTQRLAHLKIERSTTEKSYLRSWLWWLGIVLMSAGETGNFLAYGFAPASIVAPLGTVGIISNVVIAPFMLDETFRWRDFYGIFVAIGGAILVILSANSKEPQLDPDTIWSLISKPAFLTYFGIVAIAVLVLVTLSPNYGRHYVAVDLGLVALFGGLTALSTKGLSSLLSVLLYRVVEYDITYLLAGTLIVTAILQIKYLNKALQNFDVTQVIPTQFVMFTISTIVGSAILYRDFENITPKRASFFVIGCLLTFMGVYLITSGQRDTSSNKQGGDSNDTSDNDETRSERGPLLARDRPNLVVTTVDGSTAYATSPAKVGTGTLLLSGFIKRTNSRGALVGAGHTSRSV